MVILCSLEISVASINMLLCSFLRLELLSEWTLIRWMEAAKIISVCAFSPTFLPDSLSLLCFFFNSQHGCVWSHCPPFPNGVMHLSRIWNLGYFDITWCRLCRNTWRVCLVLKHLLCLIYPRRLSRYSDDLKVRKYEGAQLAKIRHWVWLCLKVSLQYWAQAV